MIVTDNFLPGAAFEDLQHYCIDNDFEIVKLGEKEFSVLPTPRYLLEFFQIPDHELVLTFIRSAHADFDTDYRIHADNIIEGKKQLWLLFYTSTRKTQFLKMAQPSGNITYTVTNYRKMFPTKNLTG